MANLDRLAGLAATHQVNFTGPLSHQQVVALAQAWLPVVHFHPEERFHPVDLSGLYSEIEDEFEQLPTEIAKDEFRIRVGDGPPMDPPVIQRGNRAFGFGTGAPGALENQEVDGEAHYTHGGSFRASNQFFGSQTTVGGVPEPTLTNPRSPRHPIVVRAELRMLWETLKHELELDEVPRSEGPVDDGIRSGFDAVPSFFQRNREIEGSDVERFGDGLQRSIVLALIRAQEAQDSAAELAALRRIPKGWLLNQLAWQALQRAAFLEFHLIYAYNNYDEYGTFPFANFHEGDNEGFCLVFERQDLERMAENDQEFPPNRTLPVAIITSVHEEFTEADRIRAIDPDAGDARRGLEVFVARGSHATYLDVGDFDVLGLEDLLVDIPARGGLLSLLGLILLPEHFLALVLLLAIAEHFVDSEDQTSDGGITAGPGLPGPDDSTDTHLEPQLEVTPLSSFNSGANIYNLAFQDRQSLAIRAFDGFLGTDDGRINHSPQWLNKTGRFFRDLIRGLNNGALRPLREPPARNP